jgi:nicotinamidase-related amidase
MADSVLATLLAQSQPAIEGNQALMVFGLQNDFIGSDAKVPLPLESGWLESIKELIPKFRDFAGDIIFVRSEVNQEGFKELDKTQVILYSSDSDTVPEVENTGESSTKDKDKSLNKSKKKKRKKKRNKLTQFLNYMAKKDQPGIIIPDHAEVRAIFRELAGNGPCCIPGTDGAAFRDDIEALIQPDDTVIIKSNFSAFSETNLLLLLRMKMITELFLVGCMTNVSIFATAQEAARHGLILNIVEDCLGFKTQKWHDVALKAMKDIMGAHTTTSSAIIAALEQHSDSNGAETPQSVETTTATNDLAAALSQLGLESRGRSSQLSQNVSITELTESLAASSLSASNRRSLNSPPQPQSTTVSRPPTANASGEAHSPLSDRNLRTFRSSPDIRSRANMRVRVRKRNEAELPNVPELPKAATHAKTASQGGDAKKRMTQSTLEAKDNKEKENEPEKSGEGTR